MTNKNNKPVNFSGSQTAWANGAVWAKDAVIDRPDSIYTCIPNKDTDYCTGCSCFDCPFQD